MSVHFSLFADILQYLIITCKCVAIVSFKPRFHYDFLLHFYIYISFPVASAVIVLILVSVDVLSLIPLPGSATVQALLARPRASGFHRYCAWGNQLASAPCAVAFV